MDSRRVMSLGGVAFVVLVVIAVVGLGGSTPGTGDSPAEIASFYDNHEVRQAISAFVLAASVPFLIVFAAMLAEALAAGDAARRSTWSSVLVGGSVLTGAGVLIVALVHFSLADGAGDVGPVALQALNVLDNDFWVAFNPALGVMMLGAAGAYLTSTVGPRWLGWSALVLGIALFIPFADFFALLLSGVWIVVSSVLLYRGREAVTSPVTA